MTISIDQLNNDHREVAKAAREKIMAIISGRALNETMSNSHEAPTYSTDEKEVE